jgi:inosine/xanthosine triphosphate pyrophosphatase family protein
MKTILLATQNEAKIKLFSKLITDVCGEFEFVNLKELGIEADVLESGTIEERARQKAKFYFQKTAEMGHGFDYVLGSDDGIEIPGIVGANAETKKIVSQIINDNLIQIGQSVNILRAFCFVSKLGLKELITKIPLKYIGNKEQIAKITGQYPLSFLLSHIDKNQAIVDTSVEQITIYNLKYSNRIKSLEL